MVNYNYFLSTWISLNMFVCLSFVLLVLFIVFVFRLFKDIFSKIVGIIVFIGGVGNLYQRHIYTAVLDPYNFFDLFYFNIYDIMITLGCLTLFGRLFINTVEPKKHSNVKENRYKNT